MPGNLLKKYNQLLDYLYSSETENIKSFRRIFDRDIKDNAFFRFRKKQIKPTTAEGEDAMDRLFRHLTTVVTDKKINKREYETQRCIRLHWILFHIEERKPDKVLVFTVENENRVYILDKVERYVVILEPLRNGVEYFLLTAYKLEPGSFKAIMTKYEKRGSKFV